MSRRSRSSFFGFSSSSSLRSAHNLRRLFPLSEAKFSYKFEVPMVALSHPIHSQLLKSPLILYVLLLFYGDQKDFLIVKNHNRCTGGLVLLEIVKLELQDAIQSQILNQKRKKLIPGVVFYT